MHSTSSVNCYSIFNNLTHGVIPMVKILENEDCGRGCRDAKRNSGLFITRDNAALKTKNKVLKRSWSRQAATLSPGKGISLGCVFLFDNWNIVKVICIHCFIRFLFIPLTDTSKIQLIDYVVSWTWWFIFKQYFPTSCILTFLENCVRTYIMRVLFFFKQLIAWQFCSSFRKCYLEHKILCLVE